MHEGGIARKRSCGNQSIYKRQTTGRFPNDIKRKQGNFFVHSNHFGKQLLVGQERFRYFILRGAQREQAAAHLGQRRTGKQQFGLLILEQRLHSLPARFLTIMRQERRSIEQITHVSLFGAFCYQFSHRIALG